MLTRLVSGGQTGVDRAALDAALECPDVEAGGWCPKGRKAEDGPLPDRYPLRETPAERYAQRTEWNVRDSDGTLVLTRGPVTGGTRLTVELAREYGRPHLVIDCSAPGGTDVPSAPSVPDGAEGESRDRVERIAGWIAEEGIGTLNMAGPRASTAPGIYGEARGLVERLLDRVRRGEPRA